MPIVDHGVQVNSTTQWTYGASPDPTGTSWIFIEAHWYGAVGETVHWVTLDLTSGVETLTELTTHTYPNSNFVIANQLRAANGRIFFLCFGNHLAYYEPTTKVIALLPEMVESPADNPNSSWGPYTAWFDHAGMLYIATQESQYRPSFVWTLDPVTLTQTPLGYVGSGALSYTTYGYRGASDTGTSKKFTYVAFGQNPWQGWYIDHTDPNNITTGQLMLPDGVTPLQVPSTGVIQFQEILVGGVSQGFAVITDTNLGQPSNVRTYYWVLDGATYTYTAGLGPPAGAPAARVVTPASNPLVNPPDIDASGGAGIVYWRPHGSTGDYTTMPYTIEGAAPVVIESLYPTATGIGGNAAVYNGAFKRDQPADTLQWNGPWRTYGVSEPVWILVGSVLYVCGYPNGTLDVWDPAQAWNLHTTPSNPTLLGYIGLNGTQYAGIKYARRIAWGAGAGASGRIYVAGDRDRNGVGCGVGSWDKASTAFAGCYSSSSGSTGPAAMASSLTTGLLVDSGLGYVVLATRLTSPPGSAPLFIFDYAFNSVATPAPVANLANLGQIFPTSTAHVICGVTQSPNGKLALYQYDVQALALLNYVETTIAGAPSGMAAHPVNGAIWVFVGKALYLVDVDTLSVSPLLDLTAKAPIGVCSFSSDQKTFWFAGGSPSGVNGGELYSIPTLLAANSNMRRLERRRAYAP